MVSSAAMRGLLACLVLLVAAPARAGEPPPVGFAGIEAPDLAPWDAGRVRMYLHSNTTACALDARVRPRRGLVDPCVLGGTCGRFAPGEIALSLTVAAGTPTAVTASAPNGLKPVAKCLRRVLRNVQLPATPARYAWRGKVRVGDVAGVTPRILRVELPSPLAHRDRPLFEHVFLARLEATPCVVTTLEPGVSAALAADLLVRPGAPAVVKVTPSTMAPPAAVACLEQALAGITLPEGMQAASVHVFFHLLQPASEHDDDGTPTLLIGGPRR
jgi:hypothetical protein